MNNIHSKNRGKRSFVKSKGSSHFIKRDKKRNRRPVSRIDPNLLIKKHVQEETIEYVPSLSYEEMDLSGKLKVNLSRKGFSYPTEIQHQTLQHLVAGRDLVGIAQTGTGKTGAFLIPIIEQLLKTGQPAQSLVVVPTRELALQVTEEFKSLTNGLGLYSSCFIGGTSIGRDLAQLRRRNHLIVGTPGRLMDLSRRSALNLQKATVLVLDEFDRMLDMGFVNDIKKIVSLMPGRRQTMLFSATLDQTQKKLIDQLLTNPVEVCVGSGAPSADLIEQDIIRVPQGENKLDMLIQLISGEEFEKVLVFAETKRLADKVNKKLNQSGVRADLIHGNKSQNYRVNALNKFKKGNVQVLVATDVAARGIDVSNVTHVINYQLPQTLESYVHRIGRTGRAGKRGKAFTFVD